MQATRTPLANADVHVRDLLTGRDATCDQSATVRDIQYSARVPVITPAGTCLVRNECAQVHRESLIVLPKLQHYALISKSAGVHFSVAPHNTAI